ncbi:Uncharacterised protein [Mycolicibacterium aurum]|uniref:Uncharacterized protein n=1 Tax=Mycolicibacterium aurum TaxID=1791 RepID=A0A3S4RQA3_MYCAU|nr:hypothetical protein [Mycolicibacterium aurum]VEG53066.1 Uncharacterised protein [Mycolicibacterium aurum]
MDVDRVTELRRWEEAGAVWQVVGRTRSSVTIELLSCDGGECVGRFTSTDPRVLGFVGDRATSQE